MAEPIKTINDFFADTVKTYGERPALSSRTPGGKGWDTLTYNDLDDLVRRFSLGLRTLGIEPGDHVAILSENAVRWAVADLATLAIGGVTVPIYPTLPAAQIAHVLKDSGSKAIVAADAKQLAKLADIREECSDLKLIISMDDDSAKDDVLSFEAVLKEGDASGAGLTPGYEELRRSVTVDNLMSLVYTSGTTGNPKGAMLTHGCMSAAVTGAWEAFPFTPPNDSFLSFLPLCHVFERVTYCLSLAMASHTYYNDSIFKLLDNLSETKPTVMQCVPRVFESIHERVLETVSKQPEDKQRWFHWAVDINARVAERKNHGKLVRPTLWLRGLVADKIVLSKIRARFGGRLKFFVSGGAPLNVTTANFFHALGLPILEGWGLTETTAAASANPFGRAHVGTVGTARFGSEVAVAGDGELLVRGPNVMTGYWNNPTATAEVIDAEGWFHTGDIGEIDKEGYIKITDRKKDIIVLANGKNVAPQPIEGRIRQSPYIAEIVLLGDRAGGVSALIVPNFDKVKQWFKENGKEKPTDEEITTNSDVRKLFKLEIEKNAGELADFEKVKRFALLDHALTVDGGELTPTLKVKRKVVSEKYGKLLEKD